MPQTQSYASALRPLKSTELACYTGLQQPEQALMSRGMIAAIPFDLILEPHTLQLHALLEDRELLTYAAFAEDLPAGESLSVVAQALIDDINQGCRNLERLVEMHKLGVLEQHPVGRVGQLHEHSPIRLGGHTH